jgi:hypothetical protein
MYSHYSENSKGCTYIRSFFVYNLTLYPIVLLLIRLYSLILLLYYMLFIFTFTLHLTINNIYTIVYRVVDTSKTS